jgi:hypothetical protein
VLKSKKLFLSLLVMVLLTFAGVNNVANASTKIEWCEFLNYADLGYNPMLNRVEADDTVSYQCFVDFDQPEKVYPGGAVKLEMYIFCMDKDNYSFVEVILPDHLKVEPLTSNLWCAVENVDTAKVKNVGEVKYEIPVYRWAAPVLPVGNVLRLETKHGLMQSVDGFYALVPEQPGEYEIAVHLGKNGQVLKSETYTLKVGKLPFSTKTAWKSNIKYSKFAIATWYPEAKTKEECLELAEKTGDKAFTVNFVSGGDIMLARPGRVEISPCEEASNQIITQKQFPEGYYYAALESSGNVPYQVWETDNLPHEGATGWAGGVIPTVEVENDVVPQYNYSFVALFILLLLVFIACLLRRPVCVSTEAAPEGVRVFRDRRGPVKVKVSVVSGVQELAKLELAREESVVLPVPGPETVRVKVPAWYRNVSKRKEAVVKNAEGQERDKT